MFLIQTFIVMSVVYWLSAGIAECFFTSDEEQQLDPIVRVGLGFLFTITFFSAACLIMSVSQAWGFGLLLLLSYLAGTASFSWRQIIPSLKTKLQRYSKTFGIFLLGTVVFFAPLFIAHSYGPFSEGGGDISIYADTAKYLQDNQLTEQGFRSTHLSDIPHNIKKLVFPRSVYERWHDFNNYLNNPPFAEFASNRSIMLNSMSLFLYVPYFTYGFLTVDTNYHVYFGIQAFLYICMLGGLWSFFRRFGAPIASLAVLLAVSSHSIISVFYNMYAMQANSMAMSALILAMLPTIRLFSFAGLRTYGPALLLMWISYILYFAVVMPLIAAVTLFTRSGQSNATTKPKKYAPLAKTAIVIFCLLCAVVFWIGSQKSLAFLVNLLDMSFFTREVNAFLGDQVAYFSWKWLSFMLGFLSQQHFLPFAIEYNSIYWIIGIGSAGALCAVLVGVYIMIKIQLSSTSYSREKKLYGLIYLFGLMTLLFQYYLARSSLYFQAKGAQNVLIYLYAIMVLPLAVGVLAKRDGVRLRYSITLVAIALLVFSTMMISIRAFYVVNLAYSRDRGGILEPSYFAEAKRINKTDPNAFVLFEPRKSVDLYVSIQPFFGTRMVSTRHLVLKTLTLIGDQDIAWFNIPIMQTNFYTALNERKSLATFALSPIPSLYIRDPKILPSAADAPTMRYVYGELRWFNTTVLASDLISSNTLPHLWLLASTCPSKTVLHGCHWKATQLISQPTPTILLFADDYDQNFDERSLSKDPKQTAMVSYLRNGSAMVFLPNGGGNVEVTMQPRDMSNYADMLKEVSKRVSNHEFGEKTQFLVDEQNIKLIYDLPKTDKATLKLIARYTGEYWLNVKINHSDLK